MADTSIINRIKNRTNELKKDYCFLEEVAYDDGATIAQYAGSERLSKLVLKLDSLLTDCNEVSDDNVRRELQANIISLLYPVELALSDARLFECDPAANFEDYVSSVPESISLVVTT